VTTWLPVNPNHATGVNVASQDGDPTSLLNFYRSMLRLRRSTQALLAGDYRPLRPQSDTYLAFLRHDATARQTCLVALNFSDQAERVSLEFADHRAYLLFSSKERAGQPLRIDRLDLAPFEIVVAELT
jgi:glycosidase